MSQVETAQRVRHGRSAKTQPFSTYTRQVTAGCRVFVDPVADDFPFHKIEDIPTYQSNQLTLSTCNIRYLWNWSFSVSRRRWKAVHRRVYLMFGQHGLYRYQPATGRLSNLDRSNNHEISCPARLFNDDGVGATSFTLSAIYSSRRELWCNPIRFLATPEFSMVQSTGKPHLFL